MGKKHYYSIYCLLVITYHVLCNNYVTILYNKSTSSTIGHSNVGYLTI